MSELNCTPRSLDEYPDMLIPRMYFTFEDEVFQYHIPHADIASAVLLPSPPGYLQTKPPKKSFEARLESFASKNKAGEINIEHTEQFVVTSLRLHRLPPYDEVDPGIKLFYEKITAQNKTRLPYLKARKALLDAMIGLSELQYHFGIPTDMYDPSLPQCPARFSLVYDYNHYAPTTIVRPEFQETLDTLGYEKRTELSIVAQNYVTAYDPEVIDARRNYSRVESMAIGLYGIYSNSMDFAYGQRGDTVDDALLDYDLLGFRAQTGDLYKASAHNSGVLYEDIFGMLAVGMLNRLALERTAPNFLQ